MHELVIAPTAFDSAHRLETKEKGWFLETVDQLRRNPAHPSLSVHPVDRSSPGVKSARVGRDLRLIFHQDGHLITVLHVGHHDPAYAWAEGRTIDRHSITGAIQIVEAVETVREIERIVELESPLFAERSDDYLLSLGVPKLWLPALREVRTDDDLLTFCTKASDDVAERLLRLGNGELVTPPSPVDATAPVAESASLRQRLYVVERMDDLGRALDAPLERWITFLHPSQRFLADGTFNGPVKISGSAGTGKTVALLHRARTLANRGLRVLLTSFTAVLCRNLERQLQKLCSPSELELITVSTSHKQALRLARLDAPRLRPVNHQQIEKLLDRLVPRYAPSFSTPFVFAEWQYVVQAQGLTSWHEYRKARRTGRGQALSVLDRRSLWAVFDAVRQRLAEDGRADWPDLCRLAVRRLEAHPEERWDAVLVDEVQDLTTSSLRFAYRLCQNPANFMIAGDAGQRIYEGGFSLSALGIAIRGRSHVLRINYRTTEEIRRVADRVLGTETDDLDGGLVSRTGTYSLIRGPFPALSGFDDAQAERQHALSVLQRWIDGGRSASEIAVFARTKRLLTEFAQTLDRAGLPWHILQKSDPPPAEERIRLVTMHGTKGLEFKAVLVLAAGADRIPNRYTLERFEDPHDRDRAIERERRLLYVAMTRARDQLVVSWSGEPSPFLEPHLDSGEKAEQ